MVSAVEARQASMATVEMRAMGVMPATAAPEVLGLPSQEAVVTAATAATIQARAGLVVLRAVVGWAGQTVQPVLMASGVMGVMGERVLTIHPVASVEQAAMGGLVVTLVTEGSVVLAVSP